MKTSINIAYIDDNIDSYTKKYLQNFCQEQSQNNPSQDVTYTSISFKQESGKSPNDYLNGISNMNIDIFIIDSQLFDNQSRNSPIYGEAISIYIKKNLFNKECIVLSQNNHKTNKSFDIIPKFASSGATSPSRQRMTKNMIQQYANDFYNKELKNRILNAIQNIIYTRTIVLQRIINDNSINQCVRDEFSELMDSGLATYSNLTDNKIQNFIDLLNKIIAENNAIETGKDSKTHE